jgi:transposase
VLKAQKERATMNKATTTLETIGCDLGDKKSAICRVGTDGKVLERTEVLTKKTSMAKFFTRPRVHVVLEVGAQSRWVSELLKQLGHDVTIANPRRVALISQNDNKSDRTDAELLARLGRADPSLLSPMEHRSPEAQAELAVAKARDTLIGARTQLINHVRAVVKSFRTRLPSCASESFHKKTLELLPDALKPALAPLYQVLGEVAQQLRTHDKSIEKIAKKHPEVAALEQVYGVGVLTAVTFILTLGDKNRFASSRMAGAYLGLRPRKSQSGNDDPQLRITKAGDPFLRRLLVNCANHILGPFGKESDLRTWGLRLVQRGGKNARKRAKVAIARKLAVLLHRLRITGEVYEPTGYRAKRLAA